MAQDRLRQATERKAFAEKTLTDLDAARATIQKERLRAERDVRRAAYDLFLEAHGVYVGMPLVESVEWYRFIEDIDWPPEQLVISSIEPATGTVVVGGKYEIRLAVPIGIVKTMKRPS